MLVSGPTSDGGVISRYECKYFVSAAVTAAIREYLKPFVKPDAFASAREGHCYEVCSLYLDSPDLRLYRMTQEGHKNRFKLRMRRYGDGPGEPVYLEIKRRSDNVVLKRRSRVDLGYASRLLEGMAGSGPEPVSCHDRESAEFYNLLRSVQAGPVIRVKYRREAYESRGGEPLRITFDSNVSYSLTRDHVLSLNGGKWESIDSQATIMELKFSGTFPIWVRRLIDGFQLQRRSIPKYVMSIEQAQQRGSYMPLANRLVSKFVAPPEFHPKGS